MNAPLTSKSAALQACCSAHRGYTIQVCCCLVGLTSRPAASLRSRTKVKATVSNTNNAFTQSVSSERDGLVEGSVGVRDCSLFAVSRNRMKDSKRTRAANMIHKQSFWVFVALLHGWLVTRTNPWFKKRVPTNAGGVVALALICAALYIIRGWLPRPGKGLSALLVLRVIQQQAVHAPSMDGASIRYGRANVPIWDRGVYRQPACAQWLTITCATAVLQAVLHQKNCYIVHFSKCKSKADYSFCTCAAACKLCLQTGWQYLAA